MQAINVKFNSAEQVRCFINMINRFDGNFNMGSGRESVNAKSIIGVCSLDLSIPQVLRSDASDYRLYENLRPYMA